MGLALFVIPEPEPEPERIPRNVEELYRRVRKDFKAFQEFQRLFTESPSTLEFRRAHKTLDEIKMTTTKVYTDYATFQNKPPSSRFIEHPKLQENWEKLRANVLELYVQVDQIRQRDYKRGYILFKLIDLNVSLGLVIETLRNFTNIERERSNRPLLREDE